MTKVWAVADGEENLLVYVIKIFRTKERAERFAVEVTARDWRRISDIAWEDVENIGSIGAVRGRFMTKDSQQVIWLIQYKLEG